jgi:hypothetical protein
MCSRILRVCFVSVIMLKIRISFPPLPASSISWVLNLTCNPTAQDALSAHYNLSSCSNEQSRRSKVRQILQNFTFERPDTSASELRCLKRLGIIGKRAHKGSLIRTFCYVMLISSIFNYCCYFSPPPPLQLSLKCPKSSNHSALLSSHQSYAPVQLTF